MANPTLTPPRPPTNKTGLFSKIRETQVWKSIFRHGYPDTPRNRALAVLSNVFLHLHPVRVRKSGIRALVHVVHGRADVLPVPRRDRHRHPADVLLPADRRASAYNDILALREHVPLGMMREMHRWGAHAMVITVWLHMFRVFLTGSYKPPREFNWVVGVILLRADAAALVHRLPAAVGPARDLGHHGRHEHGARHAASSGTRVRSPACSRSTGIQLVTRRRRRALRAARRALRRARARCCASTCCTASSSR